MLTLPLVWCGCSGDAFEYEGMAGEPIPASFDAWVPGAAVSVDGALESDFLIDTGAPFTMLDTDSFPGTEDGKHRVDVDAFELQFPSLKVVAFDVFSYDQGDEGGHDGIVGGDLLRHFALSVDYQGERLWLDDAWDSTLPRGVAADSVGAMQTIDVDVSGGGLASVPGVCVGGCGTIKLPATRVLVSAKLEDVADPIWLLVDTGATAVVLEQTVINWLDAAGRPRLDGVTVGTADGETTAYFTRVGSLRLGDGAIEERSVSVLVLPDAALFEGLSAEVGVPVMGLIGGSFLRHFLATIDYQGERLALSRYVDQSHVDPDEFVRVGFTMAKRDGVWEVRDVNPGTDAEAEGLVSGEVISRIDTAEIDGLGESTVAALFARFSLGDEVPVGVMRGGSVEVLPILVEDLLPAFEGQ